MSVSFFPGGYAGYERHLPGMTYPKRLPIMCIYGPLVSLIQLLLYVFPLGEMLSWIAQN